jgi:HK97 family phage major capsid protein
MADTSTVDEARNSELIELRNKAADLDAELAALYVAKPKNEDEQRANDERWDDVIAERDAITPTLDKLEERARRMTKISESTYREISGFPEIKKPVDNYFFRDVRNMSVLEARDGALKVMDDKDATVDLTPHQLDSLDKIVRASERTEMARRIIVTENPAYKRAFHKLTTDPMGTAKLTEEEGQAVLAYEQYKEGRAQSEATTQGGFALPVFIDPSVILTDQELDNPFLRTASIVDVNTNAWKGVSAAGVSWSFDAEAAEVSDDSITLAQPSVTVFMARGFIPFSIEVSQDWPGFQSEMARLLATGYDDLLLNKFTSGSGTGEPKGLLTALTAQTTSEVVTTTDGAFGQEDVYGVWKALGQKYRRRASWQMSVGVMNKIRQFGTSTNFHAFTVNLTEGAIDQLFYKPVYENAYMPDFTGTTGAANIAVVGDMSAYKIARRQGMEVELVPQLFATATNLPSGQRGWFAYARIGGNVVNTAAFKILVNT